MKRKRNSVSSDPAIEKILNERRKYRLVDVFLAYEKIYDLGVLLRERFGGYFSRATFEALDIGRRKGRILDLGTPFGFCGMKIAKQNRDFEITSLQESKKFSEISRKFAEEDLIKMDWKVGRPEDLPFRDKSFDIIVSVFDFHKWNDPLKGLKEIDRVLKSRGKAVILDVRRDRWWFFYIPSLIHNWFVGGLWLFRRTKFAFRSSYKPWEIEKFIEHLKLEGWEVRKGSYYFLVRKT